jgi:hypothetical protein
MLSKLFWQVPAIAFSETRVEELEKHASLVLGIPSLLLVSLGLAFPTDWSSAALTAFSRNYGIIVVGLAATMTFAYLVSKLLGTKASFKSFFSASSELLVLSILFFAIPVALVVYLVFNLLLKDATVFPLAFSLIPFYIFILFGWSCETLSKLKGWRGVAVAGVGMLAILAFHLALEYVVV